ncbi:disease resistance protein RPS2 protein [Dioscorea alata]|uniref:Disease resistance protein RPS2 protein n=3 Tax=Dioscorea alata TaxID=55571 RepID=A0ACB7WPU2_DIOAL|nr:disease resistance protein RPS2 protein [Dioscorea alata]KAH7690249.1 disease resistance protein RPS2 protein [Dioscorea alata]KAH7690250.1 disease resistance protein RPS2 protein [Dioscorea alata]
MEIVRELLSCACQSVWQQICQQLNYIREHEENDQTMQRELDFLRSQEKDISAKLNAGNLRHGKRPREEVTNWLKNLEEIESDVNSLGSGDAQFWLKYFSRLKRSKKTVQILHRVRDLQARGNSFAQSEDIFMDSLHGPLSSLSAPPLHGSSAERKKDEILQCIMDPEVSKIGVYGMGGIGKTTIMTQIYKELNEKKVFEIVMWVTASSSFNEKELQSKIAELLHCELSSSGDLMSRAQVLHEALGKWRNFVIILDDIWYGVSLQNVGIPEPNRSNGSKVVWTTRLMDVCNSMESQKEIKIEGLTDEEAWSLFMEKVGGEDIISLEIKPIAEQVARECGGLPLALITVGCALRKEKQLPVWRNALHELKTSSTDQIKGMTKYVFRSLKFSYDRLSSDTIRACFLYCALYPEDYKILVDELIEYWMAEGLIDEEGSIQTEKDKGHAYLKELKDACMIESINNDQYVRMHDLIRDLAINITREQFMVKAGLRLEESPKEEEWVESLERVSLIGNLIEAFQGQPNCPQLSTLLLHKSYWKPVTFSDTFFKHMHNLRVLDLSENLMKSLPESLSDLVNLHALILTGCHELKYLPSLAKLHKLRQLKLGRLSSLKELPHGLENLVKLRHLDISNGDRDRDGGWGSFPSGVLLKMPCLEILFMECSSWRLFYRSNANAEDNSTIWEIIIRLKKLTKFSTDFADVLAFNSFTNKARESEHLRNLDYFLFKLNYKYEGYIVKNDSMEKFTLPATANLMEIRDCNFIQLSDIFQWDDLRQLIFCKIDECKEMKWLGEDGDIVFPSLERLRLWYLHSFEGLYKEKAHEETLKNLRKLEIFFCHKLKYLVPNDLLVNNLQNLEEIIIRRCKEMEGIISGKTSATMASLPKLKRLTLSDLKSLTSIYHGKLVCDSLRLLEIGNCPNLKELPFLINKERPLGMRRIAACIKWWERLEWEDAQLKELLQPFLEPEASGAIVMVRGLKTITVSPNPIFLFDWFILFAWISARILSAMNI